MHITLQSICPVLMIAFFLYKKVKRSVGFQPLKPRWLYTRMILFSLLAADSGVFQHHTPSFIRLSYIRHFFAAGFWSCLQNGTFHLKNAAEKCIFALTCGLNLFY